MLPHLQKFVEVVGGGSEKSIFQIHKIKSALKMHILMHEC